MLLAIAAVAGATIAVPAASARSSAPVRSAVPPLPPSSLGSAGSRRLPTDSTQYTLTVKTTFEGGIGISPAGGTVTSSPAGIDCGNVCSAAFPAGTQVTLTATPTAGSDVRFTGRFGTSCPNPCVVTMDSDRRPITAAFVPANAPRLIVLFGGGSGSGTVTSSPAGIDCRKAAEICWVFVAPGTQVTLTATADSGSSFSYWEAEAGTGLELCSEATMSTCAVTVTSQTQVYAIFDSNSSPPPPPPPPKVCVVPNVKGKTLAAAKKTIKRNHCGVGKITKAKSSLKNKGRVIWESPKARTHLEHGAKVALKVGK